MQTIAAGFTDGSSVFSAPPGYLDAVRYALAVRLSQEWNQPLKPGVLDLANKTMAMIQARNDVTPQMTVNQGVMPAHGSRVFFNWKDGEPS